MASGWSSHVYRTDTEDEQYIGFFVDDAGAHEWIKGKEGTYEVSTEKPRQRAERLGAAAGGTPPDVE